MFYGVAGRNGLGVYNNYDDVKKSQKYLKGFRNKAFKTFREAELFAIEEHEILNPDAPIYHKLPLNRVIYDKKAY